jgi:uncharacterized membrane protein YgcG
MAGSTFQYRALSTSSTLNSRGTKVEVQHSNVSIKVTTSSMENNSITSQPRNSCVVKQQTDFIFKKNGDVKVAHVYLADGESCIQSKWGKSLYRSAQTLRDRETIRKIEGPSKAILPNPNVAILLPPPSMELIDPNQPLIGGGFEEHEQRDGSEGVNIISAGGGGMRGGNGNSGGGGGGGGNSGGGAGYQDADYQENNFNENKGGDRKIEILPPKPAPFPKNKTPPVKFETQPFLSELEK